MESPGRASRLGPHGPAHPHCTAPRNPPPEYSSPHLPLPGPQAAQATTDNKGLPPARAPLPAEVQTPHPATGGSLPPAPGPPQRPYAIPSTCPRKSRDTAGPAESAIGPAHGAPPPPPCIHPPSALAPQTIPTAVPPRQRPQPRCSVPTVSGTCSAQRPSYGG